MHIRRTSYVNLGKPITLAFISCVADQHPEDPQPEHRVPRIRHEQAVRRFLRYRANRALHSQGAGQRP